MKFLTLGKIVSLTATAVTAVTWFKPWTLNLCNLSLWLKSARTLWYAFREFYVISESENLSCTSETSEVSGSSFATLGFLLLSSGNMHNSKLKAAGKSLRHAAYGPRRPAATVNIWYIVLCFWRVYYRSSGLGLQRSPKEIWRILNSEEGTVTVTENNFSSLDSEAVVRDRLGDHRLGDHLGHQPAGKHDSNPDSNHPHTQCHSATQRL